MCEFTFSDGSSVGSDSLPGSPSAGFLYYESHLKNVYLLISAVSRGWAIVHSLECTCSPFEREDSTGIVIAL